MDKYNLFTLQVLQKAGIFTKKEYTDDGNFITEMVFSHAKKLEDFEHAILEKKFEANRINSYENNEMISGNLKYQTGLVFKNTSLAEPN